MLYVYSFSLISNMSIILLYYISDTIQWLCKLKPNYDNNVHVLYGGITFAVG